ncbi:hypothetical protein ACP5WL_29365 [Enterocloster bolteae]|uniref:hypothetical protein n=1 Tax=Lachnospiraceae TaxID=186803 RepID=UPI000E452EBE|nr:hypothetical protein [Hungatella hathewayi]RGO63200.1 hypothetical protein DXB08_33185 [Hungatella hathewayi]
MVKIDEYKENRISELTARLEEIFQLVNLDTSLNLIGRNDAFAMKLKEQQVDLKKQYFDEMISIKKELAKLQGRKSIFDDDTI